MKHIKAISWIFLAMFSFPSFAEISVIVHKDNNSEIDKTVIKRIFLGKNKFYSDGEVAVPIIQEKNDISTLFTSKVLRKSPQQLKAYWSKLVFSGGGAMPKAVNNDEDIIKLISVNPNLISYIDSSKVTDKVKVVYKF